jgi:hypothetical protein
VTPQDALSAVAGGKHRKSSLEIAYSYMSEDDVVAWRSLVEKGHYDSYKQVARAVSLFLAENYGIDHVVSSNAIPRRDS